MNHKPMKPIPVHYNVTINSKQAYLSSVKRHYKFVHTLDMKYIPLNNRRRCHLKAMVFYLTKLAKTLKQTRSLHLENYIFCVTDFFGKETLQIAKLFSQVQYLFIPLLNHHGQLKSNILWLKSLKNLKSLRCINEPHESWVRNPRTISRVYKKFSTTLRQKELETLELNLHKEFINNFKSLMLPSFPLTLKKLTIKLEAPSFNTKSLKDWAFFSNMKQLRELYLFFPAKVSVLVAILSSIASPKKLKCLGLQYPDLTTEADTKSLNKLEAKLKDYTGLTGVTLAFAFLPDDVKVFDILLKCPLKQLYIDTPVRKQVNLAPLGKFISKLKHLEELCLKLGWCFSFKGADSADSFLKDIAVLNKLKKLELCFTRGENKNGPRLFLIAFKMCLVSLVCLEEISLEFYEEGMSHEIPDILNNLGAYTDIRKLRICFRMEALKDEDFASFTKALRRLKSLQTLILDEMHFSCELKNASMFAGAIMQLTDLEVLKFERMGVLTPKTLAMLVTEIMNHKKLSELEIHCHPNFTGYSEGCPLKDLSANCGLMNLVLPKSIIGKIPHVERLTWS